MKKIIVLLCLAAFTHVSNAQNGEATVSSVANDSVVKENAKSAVDNTKSMSLEDRLNKQEQEVQALRKDNETLRTQVRQLKSALNFDGNKKITVSRRGSKQVISE
jgi:TolA-binding protein